MKKLLSKINEVTPDDMVVTPSSFLVWSLGVILMGVGVKMIVVGGVEAGHNVMGFWVLLSGFTLLFTGASMTEAKGDSDDL